MAGKSVLIVEDEIPMLQVLAEKLQEAGFVVSQAKDGQEGLQMAFSQHPSIVLLDILMPKMDGMEMMQKLRADSWGKDVPVIILTNVSPDTDTTMKAIVTFQPVYYLVKSNTKLEEVIKKVNEVTGTAS